MSEETTAGETITTPVPIPRSVAPTRDGTARWLAVGTIFGFLGVIVALIFIELPPNNEKILYTLLGALGSNTTLILGFYFGSSAISESMRARLQAPTLPTPIIVTPSAAAATPPAGLSVTSSSLP